MPFVKMNSHAYPLRLWALVGFPESGKSTFAARMRNPMLVVDADHRFNEVLSLVEGDVFALSQHPADHVVPDTIARRLTEDMPGASIRTIVIDSLTAIITPLITQAIIDNDLNRSKNKVASYKAKALALRQLQDAVTRWGVDTLWIYHLQHARDAKANRVLRTSLPDEERERLRRSLNAELHIVVEEKGRRGIRVAWSRRGRAGVTLWDESGTWAEMPERIEAAMYGPGPDPAPGQAETSAVTAPSVAENVQPEAGPLAETPADASRLPAPDQTSGNGKTDQKIAKIRTPKWFNAARNMAGRFPYYQNKDGSANLFHMSGSAFKCGYREITDENLSLVLHDLEQRAREQTAEVPNE